jgi:type IV pilus assembly protein PilO
MAISLSKLPWYGQLGLFAALAAAGLTVFYLYYELPMRTDLAAREKQLAQIRWDVNKGLQTAKKLNEFRRQVTELEARLATLRAVLPEEKDAADLLRKLQAVAVQSSLSIRTFRPSPTVNRELHAEWPIALELEGTYHNLALFFDRVGRFTRIINITAVDIKGTDGRNSGATITSSCIATTFVLLDKSAAPPPKKDAAPTPGKKAA